MSPTIIDIARMRQRITLETCTSVNGDSYGQNQPEWTTVGTYWAEVITTSGDETVNANQLKAVLTSKVTMRQLGTSGPTIVPGKFRIIFNSRTLNITSVISIDNQNAYYEIMVKEIVTI